MGTVFLAVGVSILLCMLHAVATRRWNLVRGGAPLLAVTMLLAAVFNLAG